MVEWSALLLHIWEGHDLILALEDGYPDRLLACSQLDVARMHPLVSLCLSICVHVTTQELLNRFLGILYTSA
jgi:hypothetical protein